MDVSPVQSGTKSGSDFSIERILSDESRNSREKGAPSWLCCTRYQPPRIPRSGNSSVSCRARRSGRHARVPFTAAQAAALEAAYARAPYLAPPALRALAAALQLRDDRIKIWFQNRRARERREKCATIAPPHAVTLPPTTAPQGALMATSSSWKHLKLEPYFHDKNSTVSDYAHDLPSSTFPVPLFYNQNSSFSEGSDEDRSEDRPDTPLDIETVED